jgi:hypothetical protein
MEESEIKAIKLILAVLALGLLVAVGAAFEDYGGSHHHGGLSDGYDHPPQDFGGFNDWLNPGAYYYSYSYYPTYTYYPTYYYPTYYYPTYTPVYTYTAPVVYDPVVYDPWWAANVYGLGATTYYYSSSWSWSSYRGGYYFR